MSKIISPAELRALAHELSETNIARVSEKLNAALQGQVDKIPFDGNLHFYVSGLYSSDVNLATSLLIDAGYTNVIVQAQSDMRNDVSLSILLGVPSHISVVSSTRG